MCRQPPAILRDACVRAYARAERRRVDDVAARTKALDFKRPVRNEYFRLSGFTGDTRITLFTGIHTLEYGLY